MSRSISSEPSSVKEKPTKFEPASSISEYSEPTGGICLDGTKYLCVKLVISRLEWIA